MEQEKSEPEKYHALRKPELDYVYRDEDDSQIEGSIWYKTFVGSAFFGLVAIDGQLTLRFVSGPSIPM